MAATQINSDSIGEVRRNDFDTTTTGQAVITKVVAGTNISFSSTGVDAGTGDVTINASGGSALTTNPQTASYPLVLTDAGKDVQMNVASANNLTVPLNSSVAFPIGSQVIITQVGAGQTTVVATGGVTINTALTLKLRAQNSQAVLEKTGTDTWYLSGDLEGSLASIALTGTPTAPTAAIGTNTTQIATTAFVARLMYVTALASNATANATTTNAKITSLDTLVDVGHYEFIYGVVYQSSVTTTGIKLAVNHTGTTTMFVANMRFVSTGTTATSGVADQDALVNTGQTMEGMATRTKNGSMGPTAGVDTTSSNMYAIVEGTMIVTVSGNIELYHGSETANSTQVMAGTYLKLTKLA